MGLALLKCWLTPSCAPVLLAGTLSGSAADLGEGEGAIPAVGTGLSGAGPAGWAPRAAGYLAMSIPCPPRGSWSS